MTDSPELPFWIGMLVGILVGVGISSALFFVGLCVAEKTKCKCCNDDD